MDTPTEEEIAALRKKAAEADEAISAIDEALGNGSDERRWPPGMSRFNAIKLMALDYAACKTGMENREVAKKNLQRDLTKANTEIADLRERIDKIELECNRAKFEEPMSCFYGGDLGECIEEEVVPERICNACALSFSTFALNEVTKENEKLKENNN